MTNECRRNLNIIPAGALEHDPAVTGMRQAGKLFAPDPEEWFFRGILALSDWVADLELLVIGKDSQDVAAPVVVSNICHPPQLESSIPDKFCSAFVGNRHDPIISHDIS